MDEAFSFGLWLKQRRHALHLTQAELARKIGCATVTLQKIELDERRPSTDLAQRLADVLHVVPEERTAFIKSARGERAVDRLVVRPVPAPKPPWHRTEDRLRHLPHALTPLVGRATEIATVSALVQHPAIRLLTLTGPGGIGKTRLAVAVAEAVGGTFPDGVCFVDLAPVDNPALLLPTIADRFGIRERTQSLARTMDTVLGPLRLLLVLDNFEQILAAGVEVVALLSAAPGITVLITSRAVLHLSGEHEFNVPALRLPDAIASPTLDTLLQSEAVELFIQRARAVSPGFQITAETAQVVAEICARLDGLPLAIELAAARIRLFAPGALVARLTKRLDLLTGGARDLPPRQQTMRGTIAWSCGLLEASQQRLLHRLAVFVGGWTVEAAAAVCDADGTLGLDMLEALTTLVEHSLVQPLEGLEGEPRFRMLETIREFALEQVEASGEAATLRRHHASYYLTVAEAAEPNIWGGARQVAAILQLDLEHDNFRDALQWALTTRAVETGLRISVALWWFWRLRHHNQEALRWLSAFLALDAPADGTTFATPERTRLRARALHAAGRLAAERDNARAVMLMERGLKITRDLQDTERIVAVLGDLGQVLRVQGNLVRAVPLFEESLALGLAGGVKRLIVPLFGLGAIAHAEQDQTRAVQYFEACLELGTELDDTFVIAWCHEFLGRIETEQGYYAQAALRFHHSVELLQQLRERDGLAFWLEGCAGLAVALGHTTPGCRILGAAEALRAAIDAPITRFDQLLVDRFVFAARSQIDEATFMAALAAGRALPLEQSIAYALDIIDAQ